MHRSDLKLLRTAYLDVGDNRYGHLSPEEARVGPDGAVYVQTLGCGTRLYMLKLDQKTGANTMDDGFHDANGKAGFDFANRDWPHGWTGTGLPHGVVFSR